MVTGCGQWVVDLLNSVFPLALKLPGPVEFWLIIFHAPRGGSKEC